MVDGCAGDECEVFGAGPLPKDNGAVHVVALELLLGVEVEHLDHLAGAEGEDVACGVHDGGFGFDGATGNGGLVLEVDEGDLGGFDGDDPLVGLHRGEAMFDGRFGDAQLLEL